MNFSNKEIEGLAREYRTVLSQKEGLEAQLSPVRVTVGDLEEAAVTGPGDPQALEGARQEARELWGRIGAVDRVLEKLERRIEGAMRGGLNTQVPRIPDFETRLQEIRLAAARQIGKALAVLEVFQAPGSVFVPHELVALTLAPLSGRKGEPSYYGAVVEAMTAAAQEEALQFPEIQEFNDLAARVQFLKQWRDTDPTQGAARPEQWDSAKVIVKTQDREKFLRLLVAKALRS